MRRLAALTLVAGLGTLSALAGCEAAPTLDLTVRNKASYGLQGAVTLQRVQHRSHTSQILEFELRPGAETWKQVETDAGDTMTVSVYPAGIAVSDIDSMTPHALFVRSIAFEPGTRCSFQVIEVDDAAMKRPAPKAETDQDRQD